MNNETEKPLPVGSDDLVRVSDRGEGQDATCPECRAEPGSPCTEEVAAGAMKEHGDAVHPIRITAEKLDGLSADAKSWLASACNQAADADGIVIHEPSLAECSRVGLAEITRKGWIYIPSAVMGLVYSDGYFDDANS